MENEPTTAQPYLRVTDLRVGFDTSDGPLRAVDGVSFTVRPAAPWASWGSPGRARA